MSRLLTAGLADGARGAPTCPNCQGPLTAKLICWGCCDRLCTCCGQATGSAFIELCWPCSFGEPAEDRPAEPPGVVRD